MTSDITSAEGTHMIEPGERVHLIGIGGAGMSGIARILLARGVVVSGSDAKDSRAVLALRALGARVEVGHDPAHLPEAPATVVVSTAIRATNPELVAARERGLPVVHRAQALAALTVGRRLAAVTGTAGKTSTTSMLTVALQHCGLDPSFAIGGDLAASGSGAHEGTGEIFVAEADESDASFLAFTPEVAIVTNVEPDHLDHYGTAEAYVAAFEEFLDRIVPGGSVVLCADDPGTRALGVIAQARGITVRRYGPSTSVRGAGDPRRALLSTSARTAPAPASCSATPVSSTCCGCRSPASTWPSTRSRRCWRASSSAPTRCAMLAGLAAFDGVRRRFEFRGRAAGVAVYDDYAHHPAKVAAQLKAARDVVGGHGPGRRRVPAAPLLPHPRVRDGVRRGARPGRRGGRARGLRRPGGPGARGHRRAGGRRGHAARRTRAVRAALGGGARGGRRARAVR